MDLQRRALRSVATDQYPFATKRQSPACPDCGSAHNPRIGNAWANDKTIKLREYICAVCAKVYGTAELILPDGPRITYYDEERTRAQREFTRARRRRRDADFRGKGGQTPRTRWVKIKTAIIKIVDPKDNRTRTREFGARSK